MLSKEQLSQFKSAQVAHLPVVSTPPSLHCIESRKEKKKCKFEGSKIWVRSSGIFSSYSLYYYYSHSNILSSFCCNLDTWDRYKEHTCQERPPRTQNCTASTMFGALKIIWKGTRRSNALLSLVSGFLNFINTHLQTFCQVFAAILTLGIATRNTLAESVHPFIKRALHQPCFVRQE